MSNSLSNSKSLQIEGLKFLSLHQGEVNKGTFVPLDNTTSIISVRSKILIFDRTERKAYCLPSKYMLALKKASIEVLNFEDLKGQLLKEVGEALGLKKKSTRALLESPWEAEESDCLAIFQWQEEKKRFFFYFIENEEGGETTGSADAEFERVQLHPIQHPKEGFVVFLYNEPTEPLEGVSITLGSCVAATIGCFNAVIYDQRNGKLLKVYLGHMHESVYDQLKWVDKEYITRLYSLYTKIPEDQIDLWDESRDFRSIAIGQWDEDKKGFFFPNIYCWEFDCGANCLATPQGKVDFFNFTKPVEKISWKFFDGHLANYNTLRGVILPLEGSIAYYSGSQRDPKYVIINEGLRLKVVVPSRNVSSFYDEEYTPDIEEATAFFKTFYAHSASVGYYRQNEHGGWEFVRTYRPY